MIYSFPWNRYFLLLITVFAICNDCIAVSKILRSIKTSFIQSDFNVGVKAPYFFQNQNFGTLPSYGFTKMSNEYGIIRIDNFNLNVGLGPSDLFGQQLPIGLSLSLGSIIQYYSLHKTQKLAFSFKPFDLLRFPLRANYTRHHFKENHLLRFYAGLNLIISANFLASSIAGFIPASISGYYILSGQFKIQIQGLKDHRVRVRISTIKNTGFGGEAGIGLSYTIIPIDWVDQFTKENIFFWDFAKAKVEGTIYNQHAVDYVYNLDNSNARIAYDQLISKMGFVRKNIKMFAKQKLRANSRNLNCLFSPILSDKIAQEDKDLPVDQRRVIRLFELNEVSYITKTSRNFGLVFLANSAGLTKKIRHLQFIDDDSGIKQSYYNPTYFKDTSKHLSFNLFDNYSFRSQSALWEKESNKFLGMGVFYLKRRHFIKKIQLLKMRKYLLRNFGVKIFDQIPWSDTVNLKEIETMRGPHNGRFMFQVFISPSGFKSLLDKKLSKFELGQHFKEHWLHLAKKRGRYKKHLFPHVGKELMLNQLYKVLDQDGINFKKQYLNLELNPFFVKYGIGFLLSMLDERRDDHYTVYMKLAGYQQANYSYSFGQEDHAHYWNQLFDLNFDLNLPSPTIDDLVTLHQGVQR